MRTFAGKKGGCLRTKATELASAAQSLRQRRGGEGDTLGRPDSAEVSWAEEMVGGDEPVAGEAAVAVVRGALKAAAGDAGKGLNAGAMRKAVVCELERLRGALWQERLQAHPQPEEC